MRRLLLLFAMLSFGCETETATTAVVDDRSGSVVYRVWWETTYFPTPIAPDTTSDELRSVPATDFAYALLAPGWNAASTSAPTSFVVLKSKQPLSVARGETLHIAVSDATFTGSCDVHDPLSQADADFITQRIFPGEFEGLRYDAGTCTMSPLADAGGD